MGGQCVAPVFSTNLDGEVLPGNMLALGSIHSELSLKPVSVTGVIRNSSATLISVRSNTSCYCGLFQPNIESTHCDWFNYRRTEPQRRLSAGYHVATGLVWMKSPTAETQQASPAVHSVMQSKKLASLCDGVGLRRPPRYAE